MKMSKLGKKFVNTKRHAGRNIKLVEQLFDWIDLNKITKVLEIGCGSGIVAAALADNYEMEVVGTDLDPEQIELAGTCNRESENLRFLEADAADLPFENDEFDMVLSMNVIHHIGNWQAALAEVKRVLKPGAYFVFTDLGCSKFFTRILKPMVKKYGIYTGEEITDFVKRNNFEIVYKEKPKGLLLKHYSMVFQKHQG